MFVGKTGADPGFPKARGSNSAEGGPTYNLAKCHKKNCMKLRQWGGGGGEKGFANGKVAKWKRGSVHCTNLRRFDSFDCRKV